MADADSKRCTKCGVTKLFTEFHKRPTAKDGLRGQCKTCRIENATNWIRNNRERYNKRIRDDRAIDPQKYRAWSKAYQQNDPEHYRDVKQGWVKRNPEKRSVISSKYAKAHKERGLHLVRLRQAAKLRATPSWANLAAIEAIYMDAAQATANSGVRHEVDHIVPLRSKLVCGLHCEANLRVITRDKNRAKGNRLWPDMPMEFAV